MALCKHCGQPIADNAAFCGKCGMQQEATPQHTVAPAQQHRNQLHCPQCGSTQLTITTESSVNGGLTTSRGNMSATTFSNTHRNFWVCSNCGNKFRNIQSLEEEIASTKKQIPIVTVAAIIAAVVAFFLFIQIANNPITGFLFGSFTLVAVVVAVVCFCFIFVYKKRAATMESELNYLKQNCF